MKAPSRKESAKAVATSTRRHSTTAKKLPAKASAGNLTAQTALRTTVKAATSRTPKRPPIRRHCAMRIAKKLPAKSFIKVAAKNGLQKSASRSTNLILAKHRAARDNGAVYRSLRAAIVVSCPLPSGGSLDKVTLPTGATWFIEYSLSTLFYRADLYDEMGKRTDAMVGGDRLLVIGNPGIGKSWSLNALLWRHVTKNPNDPVVLRDAKGWHFIDHDHRYRRFARIDAETLGEVLTALYPDRRRVLLLHDCNNDDDTMQFSENDVVWYSAYAIVLAASPDSSSYEVFDNNANCQHFYMPLWSYEELSCANPAITATEFTKGGGVPRSYDRATGTVRSGVLHQQQLSLTTTHSDCDTMHNSAALSRAFPLVTADRSPTRSGLMPAERYRWNHS